MERNLTKPKQIKALIKLNCENIIAREIDGSQNNISI
jgi:hypothetical protein